MPTILQTVNFIGSTAGIDLPADSRFIIPEDIYVFASGDTAINALGKAEIAVHGQVYAGGFAIGTTTTSDGDTVLVGRTGIIDGAVSMLGPNATVTNYGQITDTGSGGLMAVYFGQSGARFVNFGDVYVTDDRVFDSVIGFDASTGATFMANYGNISASINTFAFQGSFDNIVNSKVAVQASLSGVAVNTVINRGTILGGIRLGGGQDTFDGRGGRVDGFIDGGGDQDTLFGGLGPDILLGGDGDDILHFDGEDIRFGIVQGGVGADLGVNMDDTTPLTILLLLHGLEKYKGSRANELIIADGVPIAVEIDGGDGNDQIEARLFLALNDTLLGGGGDDLINGYFGNDSIGGGLGDDYLIGEVGNDTILGEFGNDTIFGGEDGDFSLDGGLGNDVIMGQGGNDTIYGGGGDDVWLDGGDGVDVIEGGAGNDLIRGEAGSDSWLNGGLGNDTIIGGLGDDNLVGGGGADQFQFYTVAEAGDSIFDFVSGTDKLFVAQSGFGQLSGFIANGAPAPINAGPHLLYNTSTGVLTYDANGVIAGGQTRLATLFGAPLQPPPTLLYEDLLFV